MTQQSLELGEAGGIAAVGRDSQRFNFILIFWMTLLTIGVAASLSLHFIDTPGAPGLKEYRNDPKYPKSKEPDVIFFDLVPSKSAAEYGRISWNNKEGDMAQSETLINITKDGFYFLYGQVTLTSGSKGSNTVKIIKKSKDREMEEIVLESDISEKSNSTGFFGKILPLEAQTSISINCSNHHLLKTDSKKNLFTFVGIYKVGELLGSRTD